MSEDDHVQVCTFSYLGFGLACIRWIASIPSQTTCSQCSCFGHDFFSRAKIILLWFDQQRCYSHQCCCCCCFVIVFTVLIMVSLLLVPFSDLLSLSTFCCNCPTRVSVAAINGDPKNIWWIWATYIFKEVNYKSCLICVLVWFSGASRISKYN